MILSGLKIKEEIGKNIFIEPFNENQLNPNSYNLRLDNKLLVYDTNHDLLGHPAVDYYLKHEHCINPSTVTAVSGAILDMKINNPTKEIIIPEEGLVLKPGRLYLGKTVEHTKTTKYVPFIEGRSSIARLGLFVHITAGFGDCGFNGYWTLEIQCIHPTIIYPNVEVCQVYYHEMAGECVPYESKYNNNDGIQSSMLYKDFIK